MFVETCIAPVNIAVIKYWGKRNQELILPINDSLSMTLNTDEMCAKTTVAASINFKTNRMWLNKKQVSFEENFRLMQCLNEVQGLAMAKGNLRIPKECKLHIVSENNFPTAAGLASSAAGYACLVYTLACLYGVEQEELSHIARQGSGSACRSIYGGFVLWSMGSLKDGTDSIAMPIVPVTHWPNMHVLILVVNDLKKKTSSTKGMQLAIETSDLIFHRSQNCVPKRISAITEAIKNCDFNKFAEITMRDSNQFHAIALDTYPPCVYMNDVSHAVVEFVTKFNGLSGESLRVAYTFDAGPNACLYLLEEHVPELITALKMSFPNDNENNVEYIKGIPVEKPNEKGTQCNGSGSWVPYGRNLFKYIIHTKIGNGPKRLDKESSLIDFSNGLPKITNV